MTAYWVSLIAVVISCLALVAAQRFANNAMRYLHINQQQMNLLIKRVERMEMALMTYNPAQNDEVPNDPIQ